MYGRDDLHLSGRGLPFLPIEGLSWAVASGLVKYDI